MQIKLLDKAIKKDAPQPNGQGTSSTVFIVSNRYKMSILKKTRD